MAQRSDRLRIPPRERFGRHEGLFDLSDAFAALPAESVERQGHIQKTLYKHGSITTAIFEFQSGSGLREHAVDGEAVLHVLSGSVRVRAEGREHELSAGQILLLDRAVPHDLVATEPSRLLLHVVLESGR